MRHFYLLFILIRFSFCKVENKKSADNRKFKATLELLKKKRKIPKQSSYERAAADGGASAPGWLATGVVSSLSRGQMRWQRYTTMLLRQKTPTEQMKGRGTRLVCERMSRNTNVVTGLVLCHHYA